MAQPGDKYTFTTLFLDGFNQPLAVVDPVIEVFCFNEDGGKVHLVDADTPMTAVDGEVGRFAHTMTIPVDFAHSPTLFAIMKGESPDDGFTILVEDQLDIVGASSSGSGSERMIARFVKGG